MTAAKTKAAFSSRTLASMHKRLEKARRELIGDLGVTEEDLRWIEQDRESELEERSQDEAAGEVLGTLEEHDYQRIREVVDALDRLADGSYGACVQCGTRISLARLRARPTATLCGACAVGQEKPWYRRAGVEGETAEEEVARLAETEGEAQVPPELTGMSDVEIATLVREQFHDQVGDALDPIRIACRHGLVTLAGEVASDELRQSAVRVVEEEIGLRVTDRMRVTELAGERPGGEKGETAAAVASGERAADVFEVAEEGLDYTPPARPTPESE
jgi:DnaK suppressor protein